MRYLLLGMMTLWMFSGCERLSMDNEVTIYVSEDQVFSEPLLKAFEKKTGIKVNAIYDTEESKGTGVMNRLIAELNNPQADLYWANEPIRAEVLRQKGILAPYKSPNAEGIPEKFKDPKGYWTGFSARVRIFVVHKDLAQKPTGVMDYLHPKYQGRSIIANPLFGTTTIHMAALYSLLGKEKLMEFLKGLKENKVAISTGNGESADLVSKGEYGFALVDSDDAVVRLRRGEVISLVYPDQEEGEMGALVIPNAVMLMKNARHPKAAKKLIDYLLSSKTEAKLAQADCAQIPLHAGVTPPKEIKALNEIRIMQVDYAKLASFMLEIQPILRQIF